eukprot:scaffold317455_cov19-Tisochrysis_lutea.AAC.1
MRVLALGWACMMKGSSVGLGIHNEGAACTSKPAAVAPARSSRALWKRFVPICPQYQRVIRTLLGNWCIVPCSETLTPVPLVVQDEEASSAAAEWEAAIRSGTLKQQALAIKASRKAALAAATNAAAAGPHRPPLLDAKGGAAASAAAVQ